MNIMDMVKGAVSNQVMGQIGGMLGIEDEKKTSSVFDTAVGSILGGLMNKSSSEEGAKQVFDMASNADTGIMDKLGDILGGGGQELEKVQQSGSGLLDGILGGSSQSSSMIQTVAKFLGLDQSMIGKLLTFVAPMLMGAIGKHVKSAGLDATGLSGLLGEQKQHLGGSLPSGLTENLGFGNLLSGAGGLGKSAMNTASSAVDSAKNAASSAANEAASAGGGLLKLLLPVIVVAAIAYTAYAFLSGQGGKAGEMLESGKAAMSQGLDLEGIDMSALGDAVTPLQEGFGEISTGFAGLKDSGEQGAKDLASKITDFTGSIDNMGLANLPAIGKTAATSMMGKFAEKIETLLGAQSETIQGILKPVVDSLIEKLKSYG